jgi:putative transposon-encoded protein
MISQQFRAPSRSVVSRGWKLGLVCGGLGLLLGGALLASAAPQNLIGIYRPSTGEWIVRGDDGSGTVIPFGAPGDVPVPRDYEGQGQTQLAVFRPSTREWFIRSSAGDTVHLQFGGEGDQPVPGDYLAFGHAQVAIFRPATREWFVRQDDGSVTPVQFGGEGDQPVPADYLGLGRLQMAVFRPTTGEWFIRTDTGDTIPIPWGTAGDIAMPGDYFGLRRAQVAIYRPSTQEWFIRNDDGSAARVQFGGPGDEPLSADLDGLGRVRLGVFRPSTGEWFLRGDDGVATRIVWGTSGDVPVPGAYSISPPAPSPGPPAPPSNLVGNAVSSTQIDLTWNDNSSDETGFKIERRSGGGAFVEVATTAANVVTFSDSGLAAATSYAYRARAFNAVGPSAYSSETSVTTQAAPVPPPAAPSNLTAAATSQTQVSLTWTDNSNNETGFRVERRTGSGAFAEIASPGANVTTFGDSGLTPATTYGYRVRAVNSTGPSSYSNETTAATQAATPAVTLAADIQPIFTAKCALSGCHAGSRPQEGMNLSSGQALQNTVNVDSMEVPSLKRVKPGDPDNSFLYEKVSKSNPRSGDRMPQIGGPLTQAQIDKIRQWIEQGAKP